jgi:hypothetical protein
VAVAVVGITTAQKIVVQVVAVLVVIALQLAHLAVGVLLNLPQP